MPDPTLPVPVPDPVAHSVRLFGHVAVVMLGVVIGAFLMTLALGAF